MSPKVRDKRWQNFDPLPVTVLLFFFATALIGLSGGELFLGFSIFSARCDYAGCSNLFTLFPNQSLTPSTHSLIILLISCITFIHSFLDGLLYLSGNLRPVYVLSTSVIMMVFWLVAVGLGAADITKAAAGSNYEYCVGAFTEKYFRRLGCWAPKARLGIEVSILILYIVSTTMAALAHERHSAFLRSEVYTWHRYHHAPAAASPLNTQEPTPPVLAILRAPDSAAPEVPQRAATGTSTWVRDETPVSAEKQEEGAKRVLSVRN